jgi:hypothetical protein
VNGGMNSKNRGCLESETTLYNTGIDCTGHFIFDQEHRMYNTNRELKCKLRTSGASDGSL